MPKVEAGRHPDPVELLPGHAPVGEIAEPRRAAPMRSNQTQVNGSSGDSLLNRLLVAVALCRDHHQGALIRVRSGEIGAVNQPRVPAERAG